MNDNSSNYNEGEAGVYQNIPVPVGNPGEKIAELAREDRSRRPVTYGDRFEDAPEFAVEDLPSEAAGAHRLPYRPREYHVPRTEATTLNRVSPGAWSTTDLLYAIAAGVRKKPAASLVVAAAAGFVIGRVAR